MSLVKKLQMKPDMKFAIVNIPEGYRELLGEFPIGTEEVAEPATGTLDMLLLFAGSIAELERVAPEALPGLKRDGLLWIAYPKKTGKIKTDITRDTGWDLVKQAGLRPVSQVALDETWSALRFRPTELVGK